MTPLPLAIIGTGKMGDAVQSLAALRGFEVVARIGRAEAGTSGPTRAMLAGAAVAIEFTTPASALANARACLAAGCPVVVGTTGWYNSLSELQREATRLNGALLTAPNFSIGVAVFEQLVNAAAERFARVGAFDAHLIETHHSAKKDAPSGTAAALARSAEQVSGRSMPITSVRTGSVPGTHEVIFDASFEQVRLVHEARDRRVFADGALSAARWLIGRRGVFTMKDVLNSVEPMSDRGST